MDLKLIFAVLAVVLFLVSAYLSPSLEGKLMNFGFASFVLAAALR